MRWSTATAATHASGISARGIAYLSLTAGLLITLAGCGGSSSAPIQIDPAEVSTETRTFVDSDRATPPNGDFTGAESRTIKTNLWYSPSQLGSDSCGADGCGLVVLAHGFGGNPDRFDIFARAIAAKGWIVAAPWFPLTNEQAPGGFSSAIGDLNSQPGDVEFLIDQLFAACKDPENPLHSRIDESRVGVIGHSLGGATAIALDRHDCCRDERVGATFLVAPATMVLPVLGEETQSRGLPTFISVGTSDFLVPPELMVEFFYEIEGYKILAIMEDYDHVTHIEAGINVPFPERIEETATLADLFFLDTLAGSSHLPAALERVREQGHEVLEEIGP